MSVIIRLQNLPLTANSIDIRTFFRGLSIPDGGVHIVGGKEGDAFIAFSTDEDARQAMNLSGNHLQESSVKLLLSSRNEMFKVIEQARQKTLGIVPNTNSLNTGLSGSTPSNANSGSTGRDPTNSGITPSPFQSHLLQQQSSTNNASNIPTSMMNSQAGGLASSTNAFGIPNMTAFTGVMNMGNNTNSTPQGISPFGIMNHPSQMSQQQQQQQQMNSMIGHGQGQGHGVTNSTMFPHSQPGSIGRGQTPGQPFNPMMSPFGPGMASLLSANNPNQTQTSLGFPTGLASNLQSQTQSQMSAHSHQQTGPGQGQGQTGFPGHQMHGMQMGGLPQAFGGNQMSQTPQGQGLHQNTGISLPGPFQSVNDRLGTVGLGLGNLGMVGNNVNNSLAGLNTSLPPPFMNPNQNPNQTTAGFGQSQGQGLGIGLDHHASSGVTDPRLQQQGQRQGSANTSGNLGTPDHGNRPGGRGGRVSRFDQPGSGNNLPSSQHDNSEENGTRHSTGANSNTTGRGRSGGGIGSRDHTRDKPSGGFGTFGRPDSTGGSGTGTGGSQRDRDRDQRGERNAKRSRSRDRTRDRDSRRRGGDRERSRDEGGRDSRRHRRTKSKSRSRSRDRDRERSRVGGSRRNSSLDSRDKNLSPDKGSKNDADDSKNSSGNDDVLIISEGTEEEFPCVKVSGLPRDVTSRELKEILRVDFRGGNDGVVRNYEEGIAYIRLETSSDFSKAFRQNGRKVGNSTIRIEGTLLEAWDTAYNLLKKNPAAARETEKDSDSRDRNRGYDTERQRDRGDHDARDNREPRDPRDRDFRNRGNQERENGTGNTECCLLIRGLPPAFSAKDVSIRILGGVRKWAFSEIVVVQNQSDGGRPSANAYVQIMSTQEAQKAIDMIARSEEGANLRTQIVGFEEIARAKKANASAGGGGGFRDKDTPRLFSPTGGSGSEAKSLFDLDIGMETGSNSVILRGVPPNMSERDIVDYFSDIGLTPMNVRIVLDMNGSRNGQAICEFQDAQRARRATTKDGMSFARSTISVQLVPRRGNNATGDLSSMSLDASAMNGPSLGMSHPPRGPRGPPGGGGLLGMRPQRYPNPLHRPPRGDPNPFVQAAMQQQGMAGVGVTGGSRGGGPRAPRMRGGGHMGRGGPRMGGPRHQGGYEYDPSGTQEMSNADGTGATDEDLTVTSNFHLESLFERKGCVVAVTNIPYSANMDNILSFLGELLETDVSRDRIIRRYNEFQQATGDARIAFDTPFDAKRAHDLLQGTTMWNRKLTVSIPSEF